MFHLSFKRIRYNKSKASLKTTKQEKETAFHQNKISILKRTSQANGAINSRILSQKSQHLFLYLSHTVIVVIVVLYLKISYKMLAMCFHLIGV